MSMSFDVVVGTVVAFVAALLCPEVFIIYHKCRVELPQHCPPVMFYLRCDTAVRCICNLKSVSVL